jgi:hypothetical protein
MVMVPVPVVVIMMIMVPVMIVGRTMLIVRPWMNAEHPIDAADSTPNCTANNPAHRSRGGISFCRTTLHSANNALRVNSDRRGKQSHNNGRFL